MSTPNEIRVWGIYVCSYICMYVFMWGKMEDVFIYHQENVYHGDRMAIGWMKKKSNDWIFHKAS